MVLLLEFLALQKSMREHLRQRIGPSQKNEVDELANLISDLIAERIRYQEEQRQRERELSAVAVVSFRIPVTMIDVLLGVGDQRALMIAFETETELELPRRYQNPRFVISGYNHNIRKALRMIEAIINEECRESNSSTYTFIPDPNADQSGTDYILCNGPINEARYRPGREGMHRG
uniref:K Homology domain-containing protein n=4 Tax=Loa loa TaxID=7209 RepID=A0A1I7VWQ1_LOALO